MQLALQSRLDYSKNGHSQSKLLGELRATVRKTAAVSYIARLILILYCIGLNIQDNNRYNIYIQFSIQYQDCSVKNVKNLVLKITTFSNRNSLPK